MAAATPDIAVAGHFSVDTLNLPIKKTPIVTLGGATTYTALAPNNLEAKTSIISRVGEHFPQSYLNWLKQEGVDISAVNRYLGEETTGFELTYSPDFTDRTLKIKTKGPALTVEDIPKNFHAKAVHLGPIANEIPYEVAAQLKKCCDILSLDPQGCTRSFDTLGNVYENAAEVDNDIFSLINIYKSSKDEISALTGESDLKLSIRAIHDVGVQTVIVTNGAKGAVLSVEGTQYNMGACHSEVLVDPTGAGDVFIGGFLTEYIKGKEPLWCGAVGSAAASLIVESIGPTYFGKKEEIYQRAHVLYEKELKQ
jgi:sugar/nucleoside kinase (ribokinase family)